MFSLRKKSSSLLLHNLKEENVQKIDLFPLNLFKSNNISAKHQRLVLVLIYLFQFTFALLIVRNY